ncbi:MAG TPA: small, acid-soluble spore protein, alpha/beta type [Candidatus Pelethenecus faecipullorum]|uniref:Small, acid-soluble spore protein, alpha/beta type n=1 Tax=Candidatus Pelethenecus faecipullorum TaxID=2840900 RepID=A0A9D1GQQ5_9MOLU|nr:small, acid-soluble spore protein, alpha/beta type [Candidatus Pelethenecus faecipullorum]
MATKKNSMSNTSNAGASRTSQENGSIGGNITKRAVERAKQTTDTEALKQEVASELGIQPGKNATAEENGRIGGEMTKKLFEKGKNN